MQILKKLECCQLPAFTLWTSLLTHYRSLTTSNHLTTNYLSVQIKAYRQSPSVQPKHFSNSYWKYTISTYDHSPSHIHTCIDRGRRCWFRFITLMVGFLMSIKSRCVTSGRCRLSKKDLFGNVIVWHLNNMAEDATDTQYLSVWNSVFARMLWLHSPGQQTSLYGIVCGIHLFLSSMLDRRPELVPTIHCIIGKYTSQFILPRQQRIRILKFSHIQFFSVSWPYAFVWLASEWRT